MTVKNDLEAAGKELGKEGTALIKEICDVAWTRLPGSKNEAEAQKFIHRKMAELGAEEIETQEFKVHSRFFRWWPEVSILLFYISILCYFIFPLLSAITSILAVFNIFMKMFSYDFLDILFKNKDSCNVIGKLKSKSGETPKRIVIIGGHTDSNYEYPIGSKYGTKLIKLLIPVFLSMLIWMLVSIIKAFSSLSSGFILGIGAEAWTAFYAPLWFDFILFGVLATIPYVSWVGLNMISSNPVPGANDNLSGVSVALSVLKYFSSKDKRPENIELWLIAFGSEEGGMKGSKHLAHIAKEQLQNGSFPAKELWVVNFDSIATKGALLIATKEPMYRCTYLPDVYEQLSKSAKKVNIPHNVKSLTAGTDSAPFGRLGIPAAGIVGMGEEHSPANWHSLEDTPENIEITGIENSIKLAIQFINDVDASLNA